MNILFLIVNSILDIITVFLYFHGLFNGRNKRISLPILIMAYITMTALITVEPMVVHLSTGFQEQIALTTWSTFITFLVTLLYNSTWRNRIFAAVSFQAMAILAENVIFITIPLSQKYSTTSQSEDVETIWNCFARLLTLCFVLIVIHIIRRRKLAYSLKYNLLVLIVPIISPIILFFVIDLIHVKFGGLYLFQLFTILGLFIINVVNYFLFDYVLLSQQLTIENKQLQQQEVFQENKYIQLSTAYRNTRSIVHDTKKHLFMLQTYLDNIENNDSTINKSKTKELHDYLCATIKDLDNTVSRVNTGILVIDAFLNNYISMAECDNTIFKTNIQIDKSLITINEYDLCVILGNLLDNSYEACKKQSSPKDISVNIATERGNLVIYITNSLPPDETNYYVRKENLVHGYGLKNVERITERYYGTFLTYIEKDRYEAIVTIPYDLENSKVC